MNADADMTVCFLKVFFIEEFKKYKTILLYFKNTLIVFFNVIQDFVNM